MHVAKSYRRGGPAYGALRDRLVGKGRDATPVRALDDISFDLHAGDMLGVIGANGAGKSTLLKLIARITHPDRGRIEVRARTASLIELGAGFHPELSAEENVRFHSALLGVRGPSIKTLIGDVMAFAELDDHRGVPVKYFSTGMLARLGFSIAALSEPGLLLVDEVLAVGDERFRARGLETIAALRARGGAVLYVSHDLDSIATHASEVMWLHDGQIASAGSPRAVIADYRDAQAPRSQ